jgi:hypothetical protein
MIQKDGSVVAELCVDFEDDVGDKGYTFWRVLRFDNICKCLILLWIKVV